MSLKEIKKSRKNINLSMQDLIFLIEDHSFLVTPGLVEGGPQGIACPHLGGFVWTKEDGFISQNNIIISDYDPEALVRFLKKM